MSEKTPDEIWSDILAELGEEIQNDLYLHLVKPMTLSENELAVSVPDEWTLEEIEDRYQARLDTIVKNIVHHDFALKFIIAQDSRDVPEQDVSVGISETKDDVAEPANLNPKYIFDKFVVGPSNQWAHAAALSVSETPDGIAYNPLFIYGGVGLGKTHLLHAIGNNVHEHHKGLKVLYVTSETFMNDLIEAILLGRRFHDFSNSSNKIRSTSSLRNKYRTADVLLIDDIQFLQRGRETQEEFFHTFNELYQSNKQIVITSDSPPQELQTLEDRLVSRFDAGLVVNLAPPEKETRVAILMQKSLDQHFDLPSEVAFYIAEVIQTHIRDLEGALAKIISYSGLHKREVTVDLAREVLNAPLQPSRESYKMITAEDIQKAVVTHFPSVKLSDLKSSRRTKSVVIPRQVAMYLCRQLTNMSFDDIGNSFGGRDHTTVIYACNKIEEDINNNPDSDFNQRIKQLIEYIKK